MKFCCMGCKNTPLFRCIKLRPTEGTIVECVTSGGQCEVRGVKSLWWFGTRPEMKQHVCIVVLQPLGVQCQTRKPLESPGFCGTQLVWCLIANALVTRQISTTPANYCTLEDMEML